MAERDVRGFYARLGVEIPAVGDRRGGSLVFR
jgi:hypothetical protein